LAFAVTDKGHAYDAALAKIRQDALEQEAALAAAHKALGVYNDEGKNPVEIPSLLRFGLGLEGRPDLAARHQAYTAKAHAEGRNAWNPFGGALTPLESEGSRGTPGLFGGMGQIDLKPEYAAMLKKESAAAGANMVSRFLRSQNFKKPAIGAAIGAGAGAVKHMLSDDPESTLAGNVVGGAALGGLTGGLYRVGQRFSAPARRADTLAARAAAKQKKNELLAYIKDLGARDARGVFNMPGSMRNVPLDATELPKRVTYMHK
jgi:hypothetical protein